MTHPAAALPDSVRAGGGAPEASAPPVLTAEQGVTISGGDHAARLAFAATLRAGAAPAAAPPAPTVELVMMVIARRGTQTW